MKRRRWKRTDNDKNISYYSPDFTEKEEGFFLAILINSAIWISTSIHHYSGLSAITNESGDQQGSQFTFKAIATTSATLPLPPAGRD